MCVIFRSYTSNLRISCFNIMKKALQVTKTMKPWLDFVEKNEYEVKDGELNEFDTDSVEEYANLYQNWLKVNEYDFFMKHYGVPSDSIIIDFGGYTGIRVNFTGNRLDLHQKIKNEVQNKG